MEFKDGEVALLRQEVPAWRPFGSSESYTVTRGTTLIIGDNEGYQSIRKVFIPKYGAFFPLFVGRSGDGYLRKL